MSPEVSTASLWLFLLLTLDSGCPLPPILGKRSSYPVVLADIFFFPKLCLFLTRPISGLNFLFPSPRTLTSLCLCGAYVSVVTSPGGFPLQNGLIRTMDPAMQHQSSLQREGACIPDFPSSPRRAGYLDEDQMEMLLERAQTETFSIKQKLDNDLKQEKKRLHQKLITKRRRELLQKVCEVLCSFLQNPSHGVTGIDVSTGWSDLVTWDAVCGWLVVTSKNAIWRGTLYFYAISVRQSLWWTSNVYTGRELEDDHDRC